MNRMDRTRVLIADDSPVARNMLIRMLSNEDGIEVVGEADTAQSCVTMLDEAGPDVILLEAAIGGGMSLPRLIGSIRDIKPYVSIVLCVELNASEEIIKAVDRSASDIIRKPYNKPNLLRVLRSI